MDRKILKLSCALLFCAFSFVYLYFYQDDIMTVTQHIASGGKTFYNPLLGAILITVILQLLQHFIDKFVRIPDCAFSLSYIPSFLILAFISSISEQTTAHHLVMKAWGWYIPLILVILAAVIYVLKRYQPYALPARSMGIFSQNTWTNLLIILIGMVWTGCFSNNDPYYHQKARIEHLIDERKYAEALDVVRTLPHTDSVTSMLTIYAAARTYKLNDSLFYYPLITGKDVMRPIRIHSLLQPDSILLKNTKKSANYQLMSFLLEKDLQQFVRYLPQYYPIDSLRPRYYAEAFRIYSLKLKDSIPAPPYEKGSYYHYYFKQ